MSEHKKYAVIFPGAGYTKDRPLLYYAGKLAISYGYELVHIDFSDMNITKEKLLDEHKMAEILAECLVRTHAALNGLDLMNADRVVFVSKSVGTVVAGAYAKEHDIPAEQIFFTPLEALEQFIKAGSGEAFFGDNDPYANPAAVQEICESYNIKYHRFKGANHSLETGLPLDDIEIMADVMRVVDGLYR